MPSLGLLDESGRPVASRLRLPGSADDYVCLLLLFDGYRRPEGRRRLPGDREYLTTHLVHTAPFAEAHLLGREESRATGLLIFAFELRSTDERYVLHPRCHNETSLVILDWGRLEAVLSRLTFDLDRHLSNAAALPLPLCTPCTKFIEYRFGLPTDDPDRWDGTHTSDERLEHFMAWLGQHRRNPFAQPTARSSGSS